MKILVIDDEKMALDIMNDILKECVKEAEIISFRDAREAIKYAENNIIEIAFVDVEMFDLDGIFVSKKLREINPKINIIFTTGYDNYTGEAMKMHASGYILKPITKEKIKAELADLRYELTENEHKLFAETFGNFELFIDGEPIKFKYKKTKELMAYLIDRRGAMCSNAVLISVLWEDEADDTDKTSYLKNIKADAKNTLEKNGLGNVLEKQRGLIGINIDSIECDYYDFLSNGQHSKYQYKGEYMSLYSWAEVTNAYLNGMNIGD